MRNVITNNRGFSLPELLVAMAIALIIMVSIFAAQRSQQKSFRTQQQIVEIQQNLRAAMYYMEKGIRMAGFDPSDSGDFGFVSSLPDYDYGGTTDAGNIAFTIDMSAADDLDNDTDGNYDELDEAGAVDANTDEQVAFRLAASPNYDNTNVLQAYVDDGVNPHGWRTLADKIDVMNFVYLDISGNVLDPLDSAAREDITTVQLSIIARTGGNVLDYKDTNSYSNLQGSTILATPNDNFRRMILTSEIRCRNLGL